MLSKPLSNRSVNYFIGVRGRIRVYHTQILCFGRDEPLEEKNYKELKKYLFNRL